MRFSVRILLRCAVLCAVSVFVTLSARAQVPMAWGSNGAGELGIGEFSGTPHPALITSVRQTSARSNHSLAVRTDGTVWAWGNNYYGQIGDGTSTHRSFPVQVLNLTNVTTVCAGDFHSLALKSDGTVWAWGFNNNGQLGDGTTTNRSTPVQVVGLSNVAAMSVGGSHSLALRSDGTVWAWGNNDDGKLGDGTTAARSTPVQVVDLANAVKVSAGSYHSMAVRTDGTVWAWGRNDYGQLGDGGKLGRTTPAQVAGLAGVAEVSAGHNHNLVVRSDGTVWAWGDNTSSQLGDGTRYNRPTPVQVPGLANVAGVSAGGSHSLAMQNDGSMWAWGYNGYGQLGDGTTTDRSTPVHMAGLTNVSAVSAGGLFSLVVRTDGTVWAWGCNESGQLGDGTTTNRSTPVQMAGPVSVAAVDAGDDHGLAAHTDGTAWAWGDNHFGQIGDGTTTDRPGPVQVAGLTDVTAVSAGWAHSLAVRGDGRVWSWGSNYSCQLGDGTTRDRSTPVGVTGLTNISAVSAGYLFSLALRNDGTVWAWGGNDSGQLGDGTTTTRSTPVQVVGLTNVVKVSAGGYHSLAVRSDGTVWAWGRNDSGQIGDGGTTLGRTTPAQVAGLTNMSAVSAGWTHSLAVGSDGTLSAWGSNGSGQIGDGTYTNRTSPVLVLNLTNVASASAGRSHSLALKSDGTVRAWGSNHDGQLGDGTNTSRSTPVRVIVLTNVATVSAGEYHCLAVSRRWLSFAAQPTEGRAETPFPVQPVVHRLVNDKPDVSFSGPVTLSIKPGTGSEGAVLGGLTTVNAVGGIATFSGLGIDRPGIGYVLAATSSLETADSTPIRVRGPAMNLSVSRQPSGAFPTRPFWVQPQILALDSGGSSDSLFTGLVTLTIKPGTGAAGAVLSGTTAVSAVNGVATFNDLSIDKPGANYVLVASSGTLPSVETAPFEVRQPITVYVNKNASGDVHDGASWATAFLTVQAGVNAALPGDEVWVAASAPAGPAYVENITLNGVSLYGGFAGTETERSQRNPAVYITVLDGNRTGRVVTTQGGIPVVDGFTIRNGYSSLGGGVRVGSRAAITNNIIKENVSTSHGGGIYVSVGPAVIANNMITSNDSYQESAGIFVKHTATITNNTISGNRGHGIYIDYLLAVHEVTIENNIVAFNRFGVVRQGSSTTGTVLLRHNDVFGNISANYFGVSDPTGTDGNISVDPQIAGYRMAHLQPNSPCRDAGDSEAVFGDIDLDGQARIQGASVDIGSDESDGTAWIIVANRIHVSSTGNDANDGLSWAKAKRTVLAGLAVAQPDDEVWVAAGVYLESVTVPMGVALYGGFAGTETSREHRNHRANASILDGTGQSWVVSVPQYGAIVDGFTIRNASSQGGMVVNGTATISNNTITGNRSSGGIYVAGGQATIVQNVFADNTGSSFRGSAITVSYSVATIKNNVITDGSGTHPAAVYVDRGSATIETNSIVNSSNSGIWVDGGKVNIANNLLTGSRYYGIVVTSSWYGLAEVGITNNTITGTLFYPAIIANIGSVSVTNNIVAFNKAGISKGSTATLTLRHNDVFGNTSYNYSGTTDPTGTDANISVDPLFIVGPSANVRLQAGSPCIDAGNDAFAVSGQVDRDGIARIQGAHVDMGAYEYVTGGPAPFTMLDVRNCLAFLAGWDDANLADLSRLDVETDGALNLLDAARIVRKASGLEANP